jgi:hypothetical protein
MEALAEAEKAALEALQTPHHEHKFTKQLRACLAGSWPGHKDEDDRDLQAAARHRQHFETSLRRMLDAVKVDRPLHGSHASTPGNVDQEEHSASGQPRSRRASHSVAAVGDQQSGANQQDEAGAAAGQKAAAAARTDSSSHDTGEDGAALQTGSVFKNKSVGGYLNNMHFATLQSAGQAEQGRHASAPQRTAGLIAAEEHKRDDAAATRESEQAPAQERMARTGSRTSLDDSDVVLDAPDLDGDVPCPSSTFVQNWNQHTSFHRRKQQIHAQADSTSSSRRSIRDEDMDRRAEAAGTQSEHAGQAKGEKLGEHENGAAAQAEPSQSVAGAGIWRTFIERVAEEMGWLWPLFRILSGLAVLELFYDTCTKTVPAACSSRQSLLDALRWVLIN